MCLHVGKSEPKPKAAFLRRTPLLALISAAAFLLIAPPAMADGGFGIYWAGIGSAPGVFITYLTSGIAFVAVIVIEAAVFLRVFKIGWLRALWISLALNLISSALGLACGFFVFVFFISVFFPIYAIALIVLFVWLIAERKYIPWWITVTVIASMLVGIVASVRSSFTYLPGLGGVEEYSGYILPLFLGFGLTLLFEGLPGRRFYDGKSLWKGILMANFISYLFLAILAAYYGPGDLNRMGYRPPGADWQSRAKGTLRSIGSSQLAYQSATKNHVYGSFQALQDVEDIAKGYTLGNMIENYSMTWVVHSISTAPTEDLPTGVISTFTIIAWPRDTRPGFLSTFAITEDQTVRVYDPDRSDIKNPRSWDPIL